MAYANDEELTRALSRGLIDHFAILSRNLQVCFSKRRGIVCKKEKKNDEGQQTLFTQGVCHNFFEVLKHSTSDPNGDILEIGRFTFQAVP